MRKDGFGSAAAFAVAAAAFHGWPARELTLVCNNAGNGETGLAALLLAGRVRKIICSFPRQVDSQVFDALYRSGRQADAMRAIGTAREHLLDELGLDLGPELRELEQRILVHDPALASPAVVT